MDKKPGLYNPGHIAGIDPRLAKNVELIWERLNWLLQEVGTLRSSADPSLGPRLDQLSVALGAVRDRLTSGSTFVGFGGGGGGGTVTQPVPTGPIDAADDVTLEIVDGVIQAKDDGISFDKMQNINTDRLLGRDTPGIGDIEEILIGVGLVLSGGTLSVTGASLDGIWEPVTVPGPGDPVIAEVDGNCDFIFAEVDGECEQVFVPDDGSWELVFTTDGGVAMTFVES